MKKKKLHTFDHQPRSQGSLRLTGIQVEFENEFKKIIFRPGANKNGKTKKSNCLSWNLLDINTTTGYISGHKDVLSTSFKTRQSKLSERKPTKRIFMTGSELRCTCYVTAYVWWTQLANRWLKLRVEMHGKNGARFNQANDSGLVVFAKKKGPDRRLSLTELFILKTFFFSGFICYCLNCNYHFDDHISIKFVLRQFTSSFMFHSFHRWRWTKQIGLLPIYGSS